MHFGLTPEQQRLKDEVVAFFKENERPEWVCIDPQKEPGKSEEYRKMGALFDKELVKRGWWTMHWPKEYGGQERDPIDQAILQETEGYYRVPTGGGHGRFIVGPAIMVFGTDEQKKKYLPPFARAEWVACLGYTEPNAGSDLAVMETRAVLHGDEYVVNGHKTFITYGHFADVMLLAARTDLDAPKHRGITLFIVDMDLPGIRVSPLPCIDGQRVNDVYFEDVKVPRSAVVGVENRGFYHMATALNFERAGVRQPASYRRTLDDFVKLCRETRRNGRPLAEDPFVRQRLAEMAMELEAWRLICWRVVWLQSKGLVPSWEASMCQYYRKEVYPKFGRAVWEITNMYGLLEHGSPLVLFDGLAEKLWTDAFNIHGQGGRNVTRNVIGRRGLDLPRGI